MKNRGITLLETLISTVVFGIIMILMFNMSSSFFQLFTASESKQAVNTNFIKVFNQMQRDIMITDSNYIYTYNTKFDTLYRNIPNRWISFPVPTDNDGKFQGEGNSFNWKKIYIYYIKCTNANCPECPKESYGAPKTKSSPYNNQTDRYRLCSDKHLIRLAYEYIGSNDKNYVASALNAFNSDIASYTLPYDYKFFPDLKEYNVNNATKKQKLFKYLGKKVIATNILDMTNSVNIKKHNITITLSSVRKDEIKKKVEYGNTDFTISPNNKYVDNMEFTIIARNI